MKPVVYAETFGLPSEVWMWRQVQASRTPVLTHNYLRPETFSHEPVWVVPKRRALLDRAGVLLPFLREDHGYRLPPPAERDVIERLRAEGATLLHAHFGPSGLRMLPVARALDIPLVVTVHGFDVLMLPENDPEYRRQLADLFTTARCIAVSDHVRERLESLGCRDPRRLYLGMPVGERVERTAHEPIRVLSVSRLAPVKGVPDLVDAVRAIDGNVELHVVGEGDDRASIAARAEGDPRIVLHGVRTPQQVKRHLAEADIFVINSRTVPPRISEAFGIAVLEAMEASLPVIGTRHGGIPESVIDGETGLLIDERDTAGLQAAIEQLARDPARRDAMGAAGRRRVETEFEIGACTERLLAFYEEVGTRSKM